MRTEANLLHKWADQFEDRMKGYDFDEDDGETLKDMLLTCSRLLEEECMRIDTHHGIDDTLKFVDGLVRLLLVLEFYADELRVDENTSSELLKVIESIQDFKERLVPVRDTIRTIRKRAKKAAKEVKAELRERF